jgi:hypothetical protein
MLDTTELRDAPYRQIKAGVAPARQGRGVPPTLEVSQPFPPTPTSNAALFELLDEPGSAR